MSSPDAIDPLIVVLGASGVVGRRICSELAAARARYALAVRHAVTDRGAAVRAEVCDAFDAGSLARAFADARVVVNAAGPLRETAAPVLVAAMAAGAHYIDVGGEQATMHALYERHESTVRRAGLVALPGAGLDCVIADLAAGWAAQHVTEETGGTEDAVRDAPAPRISEAQPLDEIATSYVFDDLVLSAGSQRALFGAIGARALVWRRDRWEAGRAGAVHRVNAANLGGERDAIAFAGGDAISIPHHVAAQLVASYASLSRRATGLARLVASALPFVPRGAANLLAPYAPPEDDYGRTRFAIIAQARRGFSTTQITVRGDDVYRTTAAITAWIAQRLAMRGAGPVGMRAPGELFHPAPALRELALAAGLEIEPSFAA